MKYKFLSLFVLYLAFSSNSIAQVDQSIIYSSYFGGSNDEFCGFNSLDVRSDKWLSGSFTTSDDMPLIGDSFQALRNGNVDGFVSLFTGSGALLYSSYLGGTDYDAVVVARFAPEGMGYAAAGTTKSLDFPVSSSAHLSELQGDEDGFVTRFNEEGELIWSTYFGGTGKDDIEDMVIDVDGNIYIAGRTTSPNLATEGVYQINHSNSFDAFLAKFDAIGNLTWCTYFGDENSDVFRSIDLSPNGSAVYCTGYTNSIANIAHNGWQNAPGGAGDGLIVSFNSADGSLNWSSFYGGDQNDECHSVVVSNTGDIYFSGRTQSQSNISSIGSHQEDFGGLQDHFIVKFNAEGNRIWGTYFGGDSEEGNRTALTMQNDNIVLMGTSNSDNNIAFGNPFDSGSSENSTYLAKFDPESQIIWGTYFLSDRSCGLLSMKAVPETGSLVGVSYISDEIDMSDIITPNAYQEDPAGGSELIFYVLSDMTVSTIEYLVKPLKIFPNPVSEFLAIERPANVHGDISLEIFDTMGKLVLRESMGFGSNRINISKLSSGAYFLNARAGDDFYRAKLMVK